MDKGAEDFLYELLNTPSPTGFEVKGQRVWANRCREFADSVDSDSYGNAWATIKGSKTTPTVMIEAHADEIGFMVKYISDDGYLRVDRIGGSDWATARGRRLTLYGEKGEVLGIIGNTAIHIRDRKDGEKAPEVHELYVDIGAKSADEVEEMGVRVGHPAVYADSAVPFGKNGIVGRALDNRIGGFIISEVIRQLAEVKPTATCFALNAVQEEIGGYGAAMASYTLKPDICLVLDVTHATDSPDIKHTQHGKVTLGGGPSVTHGTANHPLMVERIMELAKANKIPLQHEASSRFTGTDTDSIYHQRGGIPSALISLPLRYMHSIVEMADFDDVAHVIDLMTAFVRSIKADESFKVEI
ncbi:MAG: endoglucanase [Verrucomicrobiales bacterium]|nr:endoglucanase [Verrucomicrobiales bacterium]|tara:strand:- start:4526 stop:5596 length:1071 start_codon:yes stop_codon:yes gene_type:complete